jgi:16S rRNA C967 or C1407 C5-methylase (RsmB/RsmF family)
MLAPDGLLSYSTCSLNLIENEVIVVVALLTTNEEFELVDCRATLGEFKTREGVRSWIVCNDLEQRLKKRDLKA